MTPLMNTDTHSGESRAWRSYLTATFVKGLCGIIAVLVAVKAAAYTPSDPQVFANQEHYFRVLAFAALTMWIALAIGHQRRGIAAMVALVFAVFVELFLIPARDAGLPSLVAANLGVVLAWSALQLYSLSQDRLAKS